MMFSTWVIKAKVTLSFKMNKQQNKTPAGPVSFFKPPAKLFSLSHDNRSLSLFLLETKLAPHVLEARWGQEQCMSAVQQWSGVRK